jgi:hypothetical protein
MVFGEESPRFGVEVVSRLKVTLVLLSVRMRISQRSLVAENRSLYSMLFASLRPFEYPNKSRRDHLCTSAVYFRMPPSSPSPSNGQASTTCINCPASFIRLIASHAPGELKLSLLVAILSDCP